MIEYMLDVLIDFLTEYQKVIDGNKGNLQWRIPSCRVPLVA